MDPLWLLAGFLRLWQLPFASSLPQCYNPDGSSSQHIPCIAGDDDSSDTISPCCPSNSMCLDNGLCLINGLLWRGSCTARETPWPTPCAQYCQDNFTNGDTALNTCNGRLWKCGGDDRTCEDVVPFAMVGGNGFILRADQFHSDQWYNVTPNFNEDLYAENAISTSASASASASPSSTAASSTIRSSIATSTLACPTQIQDTSNGYSAASVAGAAVGVFVPLALALAGAAFVILKQRRLIRKMEDTSKNNREMQTSNHIGMI